MSDATEQSKLDAKRAEILDYNCWKPDPHNGLLKGRVNMAHCRYGVFPKGGYREQQCSRKPSVTIDDMGFCKTHAKYIQKRMDELKDKP